MPFPQRLVSGVPGLWRIWHLSSSLNKILHSTRANLENRKLWLSIPQNSLSTPTSAPHTSNRCAGSSEFSLGSCIDTLFVTDFASVSRVQKSVFANPREQHGMPKKHLHSVIFLKYFLSSSNEGENLPLNNVFRISCNSLECQHVLAALSLILLFTAPNTVGLPVVPPIQRHLEFNRHIISSVLNEENNTILIPLHFLNWTFNLTRLNYELFISPKVSISFTSMWHSDSWRENVEILKFHSKK